MKDKCHWKPMIILFGIPVFYRSSCHWNSFFREKLEICKNCGKVIEEVKDE